MYLLCALLIRRKRRTHCLVRTFVIDGLWKVVRCRAGFTVQDYCPALPPEVSSPDCLPQSGRLRRFSTSAPCGVHVSYIPLPRLFHAPLIPKSCCNLYSATRFVAYFTDANLCGGYCICLYTVSFVLKYSSYTERTCGLVYSFFCI